MRSEFFEIVGDEEFGNTGGLILAKASWNGSLLRLSLLIEASEDDPQDQWTVQAERSFAERLGSEWRDTVVLCQDHPVLVPYREDECDIYFTANHMPPQYLLGVISLACVGSVGEWHPVSRFLNSGLGLLRGASPEHGFLGRFPRPIAEALVKALAQEPIDVNLLRARAPSFWDGQQFNSYPADLEVFVFGEFFVVGHGFTFEKA
jgi:hypothetical protein